MAVLKDERKQYLQWSVRRLPEAHGKQSHLMVDGDFKKVEQITELPVKIEADNVAALNSQSGNSGFRWYLVEDATEEKPTKKAGRPSKEEDKPE
jgi:hypothetical protein